MRGGHGRVLDDQRDSVGSAARQVVSREHGAISKRERLEPGRQFEVGLLVEVVVLAQLKSLQATPDHTGSWRLQDSEGL